jgi:hypothetical protein
VARGIEEGHAAPLNLEFERGRGDGDAALLLELHPVRRGGLPVFTPANRAGKLDGPRVQQQLFRERGFAGVGMRDDGERPPARDLSLELALNRLICHPL